VATLLTAREKLTEPEQTNLPMYVSDDESLIPLDKQSPLRVNSNHLQFVVRQDVGSEIRLTVLMPKSDKRIILGAFEDKTSAMPEQLSHPKPVLGTFEEKRDIRSGVRLIPIRILRYGEHSYKIIPRHKLAPGEYVIDTQDSEFLFAVY
jgi:hypothetical protein